MANNTNDTNSADTQLPQLAAFEIRAIYEFARLTNNNALANVAYQAMNGYLYQQRKLAAWVHAQRAVNAFEL